MSNNTMLDSQTKAQILLEAIEDRKGHEPILLDLRGKVNVADFFLIVTATSLPHLRALAENVLERAKDEPGMAKPNVQGEASVEWVLMDFGDVVIHLMSEEARERYKLEQFWTTPQPKGALPPVPGTVLPETPQNAWDIEEDEDEEDEEDDVAFFASLDLEVEPIDEDIVE
ncbi:ribosome silencing factor [Armatimonas sp.]|uniref:ribosome silencing factor n=1 Tax=Armatimonas sp. TaxID=1872638 RepID=UPI00286AEFF5|nr:ribosome silencing factor [Armatimonas sp.]